MDHKKLYDEYLKAVGKHTNKVVAVDGTDVQTPSMSKGGKLGSGERFAELKSELSHQKGIKDPGALAAYIGNKKYGKAKMQKMAHAHMADGGEINELSHKEYAYAMGGQVPNFVPEGNIQHYTDGGEVQDEIDIKAQKYGWSPAMVKDLKERRASIPQTSPTPNGPGMAGPELDPLKAAQFQQGMQGMADGGEVQDEVSKTDEEKAKEEQAAKDLTDNTGYAEEDAAAEDAALGPESEDNSDEEEAGKESDNMEAMAAPMAAENDKNAVDRRQLPADTLNAKEAMSQNPDLDPAAGLQTTSALQRLINATSQPQNGLAEAQAQRDQNIAGQQIMKGANLAAAGFFHANPDRALKMIGENDQYVGLPVQKYEEMVANQQNDANSPMSQTMRKYLTSKGFKVPDGASAADLLKVAPFLAKDQALQFQLQKLLTTETGKNNRAEANLKARTEQNKTSNQLRQQQIDATKERTHAMQGGMNDRKMQSRFDLYAKALREGGDQSVKLGRTNIVRAKNLFLTNGVDPNISEKDIEKLPDSQLNKVNKINVVENGIELNRLLSGSNQSAQSTLDKLVPNNRNMDTTKVMDYLTNKLNPAQQAQALKAYMKIAARARDLNKSVVNNYMKQAVSGAGEVFNHFPDQSKILLDEFKNEGFDLNPTGSKHVSDQDQQALEHYKSMPDSDPGKASLGKILQSKGMLQ